MRNYECATRVDEFGQRATGVATRQRCFVQHDYGPILQIGRLQHVE